MHKSHTHHLNDANLNIWPYILNILNNVEADIITLENASFETIFETIKSNENRNKIQIVLYSGRGGKQIIQLQNEIIFLHNILVFLDYQENIKLFVLKDI